eukprot:5178493-Prymnesium_polylepis.1
MGRTSTVGLKPFFDVADKGGDMHAAWVASGKPTSYRNARRAYLKYASARAAAETKAAAAAAAAAVAAKRKKEKEAAARTPRAKPSSKQTLRLPSRFSAQARADKERHDREYITQHKAMTLAAAAVRKAGKAKTAGNTNKALAAKYDDELSPNNPHKLTPGSIHNWFTKEKTPGSSPKLAKVAKDAARTALVGIGKSYARVAQMENQSARTTEIVVKMIAAVAGTPHAKILQSAPQKRRMAGLLMSGADALTSEQGDSVDQRRADACTVENGLAWGDGWKQMLLERGFGVKGRRNKHTGE